MTGSYGHSTFSFNLGTSILFSVVSAPVYFPTNSAWVFPFIPIISNNWYPTDDSHSDSCEGLSLFFWLHFFNNWWCWTFFHVPVSCLYVLFGKTSVEVFCPFLIEVFFFLFDIELSWVLCIFWILTPCQSIISKYFLLFHRFSFCFVHGFLCFAKSFN